MSDPWLAELSLVGVERKRISSLTGFRKGHRLPNLKSPATDAFIGRIAEPELSDDLEMRFAALKDAFAFRRREVSKSGPSSGQGRLTTPYFDYVVSIAVDPTDSKHYRCERRVSDIADIDPLTDGRFDRVFALLFNEIEIPAKGAVDVEHVIDSIEDADPKDLILDYNADATECRVQPRNSATKITITADGLSISDASIAPSALLLSARQFIERFLADDAAPVWSARLSDS